MKRIRNVIQSDDDDDDDNQIIDETEDDKIKTHSDVLMKGLQTFREEGMFCDVTIKVKDRYFKCHKLILCTFSDYFRSLFQSGMKESLTNEVVLDADDPDVIESILKYMYTNKVDFNVGNAESILAAAEYFSIDSLRMKCERCIQRALSAENIFQYWTISKNLPDNCNLKSICVKYIVENFEYLANKNVLLHFDKDQLLFLLSTDDLDVSKEEVVMDVVKKWILHDPDTRKMHLPDLMKYVRLPLVDAVYLKTMKEDFLLNVDYRIQCYVKEAELYHKHRDKQLQVFSDRTEYRARMDKEKVLLVVSGCRHQDMLERGRNLWAYSFIQKQWSNLKNIPESMGFGFATCSYGESKLFLAGGYESSKIFCFNGIKNKWKRHGYLETDRSGHQMVAVGRSFYVIGGMHEVGFLDREIVEEVEKHSCSSKSKSSGASFCSLVVPVVDFSATAAGKRIYVLGGFNVEGGGSGVQCIDTTTASCYSIRVETLSIVEQSYSVCFNDDILVIIKDKILSFNPSRKTVEEVGKVGDVPDGAGFLRKGAQLIFVGGANRVETTGKTIVYDLQEKKRIETGLELPEPVFESGVHWLVVRKSFL